MKKTNLLCIDATNEKVNKEIESFKEVLKKIEKDLIKLENVIKKLPAQQRVFVCDTIVGVILNASNLPPYIANSIINKYSFLSNLPYANFRPPKNQDKLNQSYIG